jgi:hypothetical protein
MAAKDKKKGRWRRILGYALAVFGGLSILDWFSPIPIPTTGPAAIISGAVAMAVGFYFIYLSDVDWVSLLKRSVSRKEDREKAAQEARIDPMIPVEILRIAREKGGLLTISVAAMELNMPLDVVEAGLRECVRRGAARGDFDETRDTVVYRFPEFLPPAENLKLPE